MYGMRKNDATLNQSILVCYHSVSLYRTERLVRRREHIRSTALSTAGTFSGIKSTWQGESSVISIASVSSHPTLTHPHTLSTPIHSIDYPASLNRLCYPRISQNFTLGEISCPSPDVLSSFHIRIVPSSFSINFTAGSLTYSAPPIPFLLFPSTSNAYPFSSRPRLHLTTIDALSSSVGRLA